ncbi:MAG: DUF2344 domain-containing protein [Clostridia bacterium]|nr:DUF2344 domain-containing protein [Clostridia bacterium]
MRNVRLIYKKVGRAKYISHLDMNRLMLRVIKRSGLPVWFTKGFNPHAFITFALPLSLGFVSEYDICDFRITDDDFSNENVKNALEKSLPKDIEVVDIIEPRMKVKELCFAEFKIDIECDIKAKNSLREFLNQDEIIVEKMTKKKNLKTFDVKPKIKKLSFEDTENGVKVSMLLPCGGEDNVNPALIFDEASKNIPFDVVLVTRGKLYDKNMQLFH